LHGSDDSNNNVTGFRPDAIRMAFATIYITSVIDYPKIRCRFSCGKPMVKILFVGDISTGWFKPKSTDRPVFWNF